MVEANPAKYYFAKYFFLVFALIQWIVGSVILFGKDFSGKTFFVALVFFTLGLLLVVVYTFVSDRIRRVAVGKNKLVILEGHRNTRLEWPEVKSLRIVPFFNLYRLKVKGKKNCIYFFPSQNIDPAYGLLAKDTSRMGEIVAKRKKEYNIK